MEGPYWDGEQPTLKESVVLFVDLLGVSKMTEENASENLLRIHGALTETLPELRLPFANFSDSIVVATPYGDTVEEQNDALASVLQAANDLQFALAQRGVYLRGGVTIDDMCITATTVFGAGLVRSHRVEDKEALVPRILLDPDCEELNNVLRRQSFIPARYAYLAADMDGSLFVNYLWGTAIGITNDERTIAALELQANDVAARLEKHRRDPRRWDKFRWVAELMAHTAAELQLDRAAKERATVQPESLYRREFTD